MSLLRNVPSTNMAQPGCKIIKLISSQRDSIPGLGLLSVEQDCALQIYPARQPTLSKSTQTDNMTETTFRRGIFSLSSHLKRYDKFIKYFQSNRLMPNCCRDLFRQKKFECLRGNVLAKLCVSN